MKEKIIRGIKICIFAAGFLFLLSIVTRILVLKQTYKNRNTPETEIWDSFYAQEKNSIDILFMGSSHMYNGIDPVVFYEETGLRGLNVSSSSANMFQLYYYLLESLKYQSPKYVVLDMYSFHYTEDIDDAYLAKTFDYMTWTSGIRLRGLLDWANKSEGRSITNRILPIIQFHGRWKELDKIDFENYASFRNGFIESWQNEIIAHTAYDSSKISDDVLWEEHEYFKKFVSLCKLKGIEIILILIPFVSSEESYALQIRQAVESYNMPFFDFNETNLYKESGIDDSKDFRNSGHINARGAEKLTRTLAKKAISNELIQPAASRGKYPKWDNRVLQWKKSRKASILNQETDLREYLLLVNDVNYFTFFSRTGSDSIQRLDNEVALLLSTYGVNHEALFDQNQGYICIFDKDNGITEWHSSTGFEGQGTINRTPWKISYHPEKSLSNRNEIIIDNKAFATDNEALAFVVFDKNTAQVIDTAYFRYNKGTGDWYR